MNSQFKNKADFPKLIGVGTALPPYKLEQKDVKEFARFVYGKRLGQEIERLLTVFDHSEVKERYFSAPMEWFGKDHTFESKNKLYQDSALELSKRSIESVMHTTGFDYSDIDAIVFTSTTGFSTPSIDAKLIHLLPFRKNIKRFPLWGLGCGGGAGAISLARSLALAEHNSIILVVATECCGLTFQREDIGKAAIISTALFGDGSASAIIVGKEVNAPKPLKNLPVFLLESQTETMSDSLEVMGWNFTEKGLHVVLSKDVPTIVKTFMKEGVAKLLKKRHLDQSDIRFFITHPGGAKVLEAYESSLGINREQLRYAYHVLTNFGNMSAPTVLFILEQHLSNANQISGDYAILGALGPGFSSELLLLQF
ncbi:MAG: 3-oxoacyl-[acyl-carrier-protein] synthase III C-terminal domain-containing protein [Chloroherpetonaceae bacterium]|nr:3-oxoacyl-[acyl-carrier-protein] synthase III C-terminal domain-containing protein [Chloroherpetonaceae bacterium]